MKRATFALLISALICLSMRATTAQAQQGAQLATLTRAEAASRAGNWAAAAALWAQVVEVNPTNGRFWNELGNARASTSDLRQAIPAYQRAIELGWGLPQNTAYNIATAYAQLREKELALQWLDRAFQMGYRGVDRARRDSNLRLLHDDARFRRIVLLPGTGPMTRDEGWRFDLDALAREVKRVGYAPLLHATSGKFDAGLARLRAAIPRLTDLQIILEMMKLMRTLGDGHANIHALARPEFQLTLPMQFYMFAEGLYIIAADPKYRELLGAQVLRFDAQPVDSVVRALDPLISRDNENSIWVQQRAPYLMRHVPVLNALGLSASSREVTLSLRMLDGSTRSLKVAADTSNPNIWNVRPHPPAWIGLPQTLPGPLPLYLKNMGTAFWFEQQAGSKLVYCQFNIIRDLPNETVAQFGERLVKFVNENDVDGLVLDLRWNNGGNTLLAQPFLHQIMRSEKINRRGSLFVVIGRRTFSAAQNLATFLERHTNAIFVGEPTGSSPNFVGEEEFFTLPYSGMAANVSELLWQSAWPWDRRTWIAPLLYSPPTFAAFRRSQDPALEAIAEYRRSTPTSN
jgi:tetratricopeptide repeat protein